MICHFVSILIVSRYNIFYTLIIVCGIYTYTIFLQIENLVELNSKEKNSVDMKGKEKRDTYLFYA